MFCKECGNEIPHGEFLCNMCDKQGVPTTVELSSFVRRLFVAIAILAACIFFVLLQIDGGFRLAPNKSKHYGCLQSMQSLSKGLQSYLAENNDFNKLSQSADNGNEICDHITPGADKPADCIGDVPAKMQQNCLDYKIVVNKPAPFQYEITGHSNEKTQCGICVTETGYCPTRYSGDEPQNSPCKKSCVAAGLNSTAVCPH